MTSTPPPTTPRPRRSRLQFNLRTLLVLVLLVSLPLGWLASRLEQARKQRVAVAAIGELGGWALYDFEVDRADFLPDPFPEPRKPYGLRRLLGEDAFATVVTVGIRADVAEKLTSESSHQLLERLLDFAHVRCLYLNDSSVGDAGLKRLPELHELHNLQLGGTQITDAALVHIKRLTQLRFLNLAYTQVSDAGLVHLRGLTRLRMLSVGNTQVTDAGIVELRKALPDCEIYR